MKKKMKISISTLLLIAIGCAAQQSETVTTASGVSVKRTNLGDKENAFPLPTTNGQIMTRDIDGSLIYIDPSSLGGGGTDNQNISGSGLVGTDLTISIEDGASEVIDLSSLSGGGTDDQNISGSGLVGTDLTISIEGGTSEVIDLSSLSGGGTDNQNISGSGLDGTDLTISIEGGTSEVVDLSSLSGGSSDFFPYKENTTTSFAPDYTVDNKDHIYLKNITEITVSEPVNFVDKSGFSVEQDSTGRIYFDFADIKGKFWITNQEGAVAIVTREGSNWRVKCDFCEEYALSPELMTGNAASDPHGEVDAITGWSNQVGTTVTSDADSDVGTRAIKVTATQTGHSYASYFVTVTSGASYTCTYRYKNTSGTNGGISFVGQTGVSTMTNTVSSYTSRTATMTATGTQIEIRVRPILSAGAIGNEIIIDNISFTEN